MMFWKPLHQEVQSAADSRRTHIRPPFRPAFHDSPVSQLADDLPVRRILDQPDRRPAAIEPTEGPTPSEHFAKLIFIDVVIPNVRETSCHTHTICLFVASADDLQTTWSFPDTTPLRQRRGSCAGGFPRHPCGNNPPGADAPPPCSADSDPGRLRLPRRMMFRKHEVRPASPSLPSGRRPSAGARTEQPFVFGKKIAGRTRSKPFARGS